MFVSTFHRPGAVGTITVEMADTPQLPLLLKPVAIARAALTTQIDKAKELQKAVTGNLSDRAFDDYPSL